VISSGMPSFRTTQRVPFSPQQMFELVADLERYPAFLPLCEALVIRQHEQRQHGALLVADMTVGYRAIRETFTSLVELDASRLTVVATGAPHSRGPFQRLENRWGFRAAPGGCDVDFFISYAFKSLMLQALVGGLFDRVFRRYTRAFEERAHQVYPAVSSAPSG
jgi:coenzyme Q-binding protein COQ10